MRFFQRMRLNKVATKQLSRLWCVLPLLAAMLVAQTGIPQTGAVFTSLYSFTGGDDGGNPLGGLVQGSDGYFYGTTSNGGTNSYGTVFKMSSNGAFTSLYSFTGGNGGANPAASLVQGTNGYFYGTTQSGGGPIADGQPGGTVFRISSNGVLVILFSFSAFPSHLSVRNLGWTPETGLVQGGDGYFYGTTLYGSVWSPSSPNGGGTVFKISSLGAPTELYDFTTGNAGANPASGLVEGSDGFFYGTTQSGVVSNSGAVFKTASEPGTVSILYSFTGGDDGGNPLGGLVQGSDGKLYGTTANGGTNSAGTVFKISTNGVLTTLYSFNGKTDGENPYAGLVQGSDGYFYGTTQYGGTNGGGGTIYRISAKGEYTNLYSFSGGSDGANPQAKLVQGQDGSFYGTTFNGGLSVAGTVFRLTVPLGPPRLVILSAGTNVILTWTNTASGYTLQSANSLVPPIVWASVSATTVVVNGQNTVTNLITGKEQFFRLSQ